MTSLHENVDVEVLYYVSADQHIGTAHLASSQSWAFLFRDLI